MLPGEQKSVSYREREVGSPKSKNKLSDSFSSKSHFKVRDMSLNVKTISKHINSIAGPSLEVH